MRASVWFARNVQQAVMSKAGVIPTMIRNGNSNKSSREREVKVPGEGNFVVGKSVVGGKDRVRGTI